MPQSAKLAAVLTLAEIQSLADTKTFARGKAYFQEGVVSRLDEGDDSVRAMVRGTHAYRVELAADHNELAYECNCPVGDDGVFCKHAVAVALSWLENSGAEGLRAEDPAPGKTNKKRKSAEEVIREYVATLGKDALEEWLLEAVGRDLSLRDKLLFAAHAAGPTDLNGMKAVVRQATCISRSLDWRESGEYGNNLILLADILRERLSGPPSRAAEVVELSELAIAGAEKSFEQIDDSGGYLMPAILALASIHLDACKLTGPEPVKLAERLFRFQTEGEWDTFRNAVPAYAEPLGKRGLSRYRQLVNQAWEALPTLAPGKQSIRSYDSRRIQLEQAMEALAELDGDIEALIRIRAKDLSSPYRFLLIAELCVKHDRVDEGLAWAERGMKESRENVDPRLLDFCIDAYLRQRKFDEADAFAWRRFERRPTAEAFTTLLNVATATDKHDETRARALRHLRSLIREEEAVAQSKRPHWQRATRTELVRIFLARKENDNAWTTFMGGPVDSPLWAEMASVRGKTHPHDAIALYHRLLPIAVGNGSINARYDDAFDVAQAIGMLRTNLGERAEFAVELEEIRAEYRIKRNFIKLLAKLF